MIAKDFDSNAAASDPRRDAGRRAESQMAFYLHRAFANDPEVYVLNNLRLVDPEQPEHTGADGSCQIDHLVLHRWGAFIIESKSVRGALVIRSDGHGGSEWSRSSKWETDGIPSPIRQAERQGAFLRVYLQRHRQQLIGKVPIGMRTLTKVLRGTDQRGFTRFPIQLIVAVSDSGSIRRVNGWKEPSEPFQTYVCKADEVPSKITAELSKHAAASSLLAEANGDYGVWSCDKQEVATVSEFLANSHTAPPSVPQRQPPDVRCKQCSGTRLAARSGRHGYYWRCADCEVNTAMPLVCGSCRTKSSHGGPVRIVKEGPRYERRCESCGVNEPLWIDPPTTTASS